MRSILLSFDAITYDELENGKLKFEYRKVLPKEETIVYFYVSRPVMAITGIAHFGRRELLANWLNTYSDRPADVIERIKEYMADCTYVVQIKKFQATNKIPLNKVRENISDFVVPRMYYYLDNTPLLEYLQRELYPTKEAVDNSFDEVLNSEICK